MSRWICSPAVLIFLLVFSRFALAQSQTFSASSACGVALIHQTIAIDDDGHHSISLDQRECTFQSSTQLAGLRVDTYIASGVDDVQFDKSKDQGYAVGQSASGDKYFLRYEGTATLKGGVPLQLQGTWRFTGGTGKLLHLTGSGTYSAEPTSAGGMTFKLQGTYEVLADGSRPRS